MTSAASPAMDSIRRAAEARRPDLMGLAQSLVRAPSLPGDEQAVQDLVFARLGAMGLDPVVQPVRFERMRDHPAFGDDGFTPDGRVNVIGRWQGTGRGRSLILNGHVDVVSTGDPALWQDPPWSGVIRDGWLYGRGSCDMKSGLTAGIMAVQVLQDLGWRPTGDVIIESVVGEESGGCGTLMTIVEGIRADAAVILEPTGMTLCPVQSGALTFRITVPGRAAHAAMRQYGVSAIEKFALLQQAILQLEHQRHANYKNLLYPEQGYIAPVSIGTIRGGEWHSTVPELVVAEGRFGVFPGEPTSAARDALELRVAEVAAQDDWLFEHPPRVEWFEGQFESGETLVNHPLINSLAGVHREARGSDPAIRGVPYGSDLRLFTNHAGVAAVLYGPGDVSLAHAANECILIDEVVEAVVVIAGFVGAWCGESA